MDKCAFCGSELPPQTRFCGVCGTMQPDRTMRDESRGIETLPSGPHGENIPPPPPQPQQNNEGQFGQGEHRPKTESSPGQPGNPPSGPHPQQQTSYDDYQQSQHLQQPYSNYQSPPQAQQLYGGYQPAPPPYNYQPNPPPSNYQPNPPSQPPYGVYQATQPYNGYQQPPQPNVYQPISQPSGIHSSDTAANVHPGFTGPIPVKTEKPQKAPDWRKWAIIAVVVVVILAGTGVLAFSVFKPTSPPLMPSISVTSKYQDTNGTPAGSGRATGDSTTLHVTGKQFAANSAVTFLLDSIAVDVHPESDASGTFSTDLPVTSSWPIGQHKLTAHDASNNTTNAGVAISIVQQGEAGTPGPYNSPTDTQTFKITMQIHMVSIQHQAELDVTGHSDSQAGTVCSPGDDGSPQRIPVAVQNQTFYVVDSYTCSGTYKMGDVTYDETLNTSSILDPQGNVLCSLTGSQSSYIHVHGTYTASHQFEGDITRSSIAGTAYACSGQLTFPDISGETGTWTGAVS